MSDKVCIYKRLINISPCMLFMKGNPDQPICGFSCTTIELLNRNNIEYKTFDILEDNDVRQKVCIRD